MLTKKELKKYLCYDKNTGIFTWASTFGSRAALGEIAGTSNTKGYLRIQINGKIYLSHRLAWLYTHNDFPNNDIDHINHIRTDNRISNLREVTRIENMRNASMNKSNRSKVTGVYWFTRDKKWKAQIMICGRNKTLGAYFDKFEAICARMSANNKYGFHKNHGLEALDNE